MSKVNFVSLGCDKNLVDSEIMLGLIDAGGHSLTDDLSEAEIIVVNTCCFIQSAVEETIESILELARYKTNGICKGIVATGCAVERYKEEIFAELPEVDAIVGIGSYEKIVEAIQAVLDGKRCAFHSEQERGISEEVFSKRVLSIPGSYYAYLKIAEGCNNHCTYCLIPQLRGRYRSRRLENIVAEARKLAESGVKELIIVAQDTTGYGLDIYGERRLATLLAELGRIEGIRWIRIMYAYPEHITDDLIDEMARNEKVCKYLDMPIQHGTDKILKAMGRKNGTAHIRETVTRLRNAMPNICIRTTIIVGFPQETETDFDELCGFVEEIGFDRLGVFEYSQEMGTPAALMEGQISAEDKRDRKDRLMELQKHISAEACSKFVGKTLSVIVEGRLDDEDNIVCARSYRDAPEVDGLVFINISKEDNAEYIAGEFINVSVSGAYDYDLIGVIS